MTDSTELYYAEMEAARSDAEKAYFEARPQHMWMPADHALFRAGFERAFQLLWKPASTCDRGVAAAAEAKRAATHCKRGHELSGQNLFITSGGSRGCKECRKIHKRAYRGKARG